MSRRTGTRVRTALLLAFAALVVLAGCGSKPVTPPTVKTATIGGLGTILVNGQGHTLYMFVPDARHAVTCTGTCAGTWPPLKTADGKPAHAGPGVQATLLGADPSPGGGTVVTYDRWPLYTYAADINPGDVVGQALDLNGGYWYVMRPDGTPVVPHGSPPIPTS
ncbi:MAG: COG4315 family predicted lipoprotein [Mycobacteriales bacterium]